MYGRMAAPRRRATRSALLLALLAGVLGGCATATPYQQQRDGYGYTEQKLESNRYRVSFRGNAATSLDAVQNALMFRAAELTVAQHGDYFVVLNTQTEGTQSANSPTVGIGLGGFSFGSHGGVSVGFGGSTQVDKTAYSASAEIQIFSGPKSADQPTAFDARELMSNLGPLLKRP
ncbi:CC0125/CC1285 family lipoprotein [Sinimarinibacterium sp. CAU 1509]|uniref:CC0125/CC1285 family lipoprotein n=1 Tax=Sinimarinibacterium sp. CAU 1509 TaxID=2562283 RepID=UPI00200AA020|nr:hypothetical protein [Sinimarinibacterium sp. CAU 1509]